MTKASQLIDGFTDDLVQGTIESYLLDYGTAKGVPVTELARLLDEIKVGIGKYRYEKDPVKKEDLAEDALANVIAARSSGILKNNPNTIKHIAQERDFYKSQILAQKEIIEELQKQLGTKKQTELPPEKKDFTGFK
jgi:hypothetical protein